MTTWTPATKQVETWTKIAPVLPEPSIFDRAVFDPAPIFDTGNTAGGWTVQNIQTEVWTKL